MRSQRGQKSHPFFFIKNFYNFDEISQPIQALKMITIAETSPRAPLLQGEGIH